MCGGREGLCLSSNRAKCIMRLCMHCWIYVIGFEFKTLISGENCKAVQFNHKPYSTHSFFN